MKLYIENGGVRTVMSTGNYTQGVQTFLGNLAVGLAKVRGGFRKIHPITVVSKCGYYSDMLDQKMDEEIDKGKVFRSAKVIESIGLKAVGKEIRKTEKRMSSKSKTFKRLIESM